MDLLALPRSVTSSALGLGTALRGARVFHPRGQAYHGTVTVTAGPGSRSDAHLLARPATHRVIVRISRGAGLPARLPDIVGLAIRFPGLGKGGGPLDLLLNTAGGPPGLRHVFLPEPVGRTYSCVLPYRTGSGGLVMLGARASGDSAWELLSAPVIGEWSRWGRLTLGPALDPEDSAELRFEPTLGADDLQPVQLFRALRDRSYRKSQAHRR